MALGLDSKQAIVAAVRAAAQNALSAVLVDFRGMSVVELTDLRRRAREAGVQLRVVRNTLVKRAVVGTAYEGLAAAIQGPTMLALSVGEPGAAARLLKSAATEFEALAIKALAVDGQVFGAAEIDRLAELPTRTQALGQLLAVLQAPLGKLARTLNEVPGKLVRTLAAVRDAKEN